MGWRDGYHVTGYGVRAATVAMQWFGESVTTEAVFSVWSVPKANMRSKFSVENSVVSSRRELKPGVQDYRRSECEDFTCAVIQ
jgi:hypothetical protein